METLALSFLSQHQLLIYRHDSHHYQYHGVPRFECVSKFTSLRTLELGRLYHREPGNSGARLINLTMLKLRTRYGNGQLRLLERLILPALKDLSISRLSSNPGPVNLSITSLILDLILRSGIPSLERLRVRSMSREEAGELTLLLRHAPLITHLNINLPPVEDLMRLVQTVGVIASLLQVCTFYSAKLLDDGEANFCHQLALRRCEVLDHHAPVHRLRALYIEIQARV